MSKFFVTVTSAFNNGEDSRVEECRDDFDMKKRKRYYENDPTVLEVLTIVQEVF